MLIYYGRRNRLDRWHGGRREADPVEDVHYFRHPTLDVALIKLGADNRIFLPNNQEELLTHNANRMCLLPNPTYDYSIDKTVTLRMAGFGQRESYRNRSSFIVMRQLKGHIGHRFFHDLFMLGVNLFAWVDDDQGRHACPVSTKIYMR